MITLGGDIAEEREADLLVVGSNHRGVFERLLEAPVSTDLAKRALPRPRRPLTDGARGLPRPGTPSGEEGGPIGKE